MKHRQQEDGGFIHAPVSGDRTSMPWRPDCRAPLEYHCQDRSFPSDPAWSAAKKHMHGLHALGFEAMARTDAGETAANSFKSA